MSITECQPVCRPILSMEDARRMWWLYNHCNSYMTRNTQPWLYRDFQHWWETVTQSDPRNARHWWGWLYGVTGGADVGFGLLHVEEGFPQPGVTLGITNSHRRRGLGTAIYRHLAEQVVEAGYAFGWAEVRKSNMPSWRAAERAGWTRVAEARVTRVVHVFRYVSVDARYVQDADLDRLRQMPGDYTSPAN